VLHVRSNGTWISAMGRTERRSCAHSVKNIRSKIIMVATSKRRGEPSRVTSAWTSRTLTRRVESMLLVMAIVVAVRVLVPAAPAARVPSALPMMVVMALKASARLVMMVLVVMLLLSPSAPVMVIVATVPPGVASLGIAPSVAYSTQAVVICVARIVA